MLDILKKYIKGCWMAMIVASIVIIALGYAFIAGERYFSSTRFCVSCHAMSYPYEELKRSSHYGRLGINPGCGDCHFPPQFYLKVKTHIVSEITDIISNFRYDLSTKEAFDRRKDEFALKARKEIISWSSSPCKTCHKTPMPASDFGKTAHEKIKDGANCVDCHRSLVH